MTPLEALDWHRATSELYAAVRAERHVPTAHAGWVAVRDRLYAEHACSPADPAAFRGLRVPPYDPAWRVEAHLEPAAPVRLAAGDVAGTRIGVLRTPWGRLDAWWLDGHGGGLWVPVRDAGNGPLSYAGGRELLDTRSGADLGVGGDGGLVLDLNFLYAPACAHDPRRTFPAPPAGNVLDVVVPAGELLSEPLEAPLRG